MNYNESLNFIISKQSLGIMPGLTRILKLLEKMGNPQKDLKIIHIAGTNGKGTVSATIANTLTEHGYKVGLFSSPWVMDYREQIQINREFISEAEFAKYVEAYKDNDCSEFEFLTAIMYKYFADQKVDYAVVECGMGGLEDATNVEESNIAVITSVALDHTAFLGNTIEEIAYQKAGIIKENGTCVLYPNPACDHIFEKVCKEKNAKLIKVHDFQSCMQNNMNTVTETLKLLGIHTDIILSDLPARKEKIGNVLLDGGHNADAAKYLESSLSNETAVIGMMADKDIDAYLSIVAPKCKKIITTTPNNPRAISAEELKEIAEKYCHDVTAIGNPLEAVQQQGITLVCGSFFLARDVRDYLLKSNGLS
ncbi:MAG: bifunctional folylpolyglutamate synthase/dihydrofolate synthase [Eubacterium sp.]|nr:bifunctional folylpolyglutamate synthase/dihydrofolate synthase [Eubacterium sp.]